MTRWAIIICGVLGVSAIFGYGIFTQFSMLAGCVRGITSQFSAELVMVSANVLSPVLMENLPAQEKKKESNIWDTRKRLENGSWQLLVKENNVNDLLRKIVDEKFKGFVKSASITIKENNVEAHIVMIRPIPGTIVAEGSVSTKEGKLYPRIEKVHYGFMPIPKGLVRNIIDKILNQKESHEWIETPGITWEQFNLKKHEALLQFKEEK